MVNLNGIRVNSVIFDFDGVIVDTEPLHYKAFQQILEPIGLGFSWQEYVDKYMGYDDRDAFLESFSSRGKCLDKVHLAELIEVKAEAFQEIIRNGITAYPGVVELIKRLHEHGIPLAISSGALRSDIVPILATLHITDYFRFIVTADDVVKSKPDPECYEMAFAKLQNLQGQNLAKRFCVAIEDTPAGISAAVSAGLNVIAVTNSYEKEHLQSATRVVDSLEQLLAS